MLTSDEWRRERDRGAAQEMGRRHATLISSWRVAKALVAPLLTAALVVAVATVVASATPTQRGTVALYGSILAVVVNVAVAVAAWFRGWYLSPVARLASVAGVAGACFVVVSLIVWMSP